MNVGTERKMKVLDRLRSFGNHFIYYSVKQSFVTGEGRAQDCAMTGSRSTLGAKDVGASDPEPSKSTQHLTDTEDPGWASLAVAGMLNLLAMAGLHLLSLAVIREGHKDWCTLLGGHATSALHGT